MSANQARPFYRSEAFPEDVADLAAPAPTAAPRRSRPALIWLTALLPLGAVAAAVTVYLIQRTA